MRLKPLIAFASAVTAAAVLIVIVPGCGTSYAKTEVKVLYSNGSPVVGATVTLMLDGGESAQSATGQTDDNGMCSLESLGGKKGVPKGTYNALVVLTPIASGGADGNMADKMKEFMQKQGGVPGAGGGGVAPGAGGGNTGIRSRLPDKYSQVGTTPFKKIEIPHGKVIELKLEVDGPSK